MNCTSSPAYPLVAVFRNRLPLWQQSYHIRVENNPDENGQESRLTLDQKTVEASVFCSRG
jgi:hypothetical protein